MHKKREKGPNLNYFVTFDEENKQVNKIFPLAILKKQEASPSSLKSTAGIGLKWKFLEPLHPKSQKQRHLVALIQKIAKSELFWALQKFFR